MSSALVTGAAGGLGAGIVRALRADGFRVFPLDLAATDDPDGFAADVRDDADVRRALGEVVERTGTLDVLVTSHGVLQRFSTVEHITDEELRRVMSINFEGTFNVCRAAAGIMRRQGHGRIVNVASQAGRVPWPQTAIYGASKAAVIALS